MGAAMEACRLDGSPRHLQAVLRLPTGMATPLTTAHLARVRVHPKQRVGVPKAPIHQAAATGITRPTVPSTGNELGGWGFCFRIASPRLSMQCRTLVYCKLARSVFC